MNAFIRHNINDVILLQRPQDRSEEEIESVYEELLHIKALSHLSNSVKKELAAVIAFETHPQKGTVCKFSFFMPFITFIFILIFNPFAFNPI